MLTPIIGEMCFPWYTYVCGPLRVPTHARMYLPVLHSCTHLPSGLRMHVTAPMHVQVYTYMCTHTHVHTPCHVHYMCAYMHLPVHALHVYTPPTPTARITPVK